jgi:superfamily II DNA or RNA helicase
VPATRAGRVPTDDQPGPALSRRSASPSRPGRATLGPPSVNRPRGPTDPALPVDPETAARLRRLLEPGAQPALGSVRRPEGPPGERVEVAFILELAQAGGRPILEVQERRTPPGERPGKWAQARVSARTVDRFPDLSDRAIVRTLLDAAASTASAQITLDDAPTSRFALSRAACARILPLAAQSGRLRLRRPSSASTPLAWQDAPWALRLRVEVAPPDPGAPAGAPPPWDVRGLLRAEGIVVPLTELDAFIEGGFAIARGRLGRVDDGGASSWLGLLLAHHHVRITAARRASFLEELYSLPAPPPLDLPGKLALPEIVAPARPRLHVHAPDPAAPAAALFAELSFIYDGVVVSSRRPGRVAFDAARTALLRRDPEAEAKARARLDELGVTDLPKSLPLPPPEGAHLAIAQARLPAIVAALVAEGWLVEAAGRTYRRAGEWQASVRSGSDWLELEGGIDYGGVLAPLPAVLAALRRGDTSVVLDDGSLGLLPEAWLARHGIVLRLGVAHERHVRFAKSQAPLLAALAAGEPSVRVDEAFERVRGAIADHGPVAPADPPEGFTGALRGYQREGLGWLQSLDRTGLGGLLADDMGLGKTVQVLALLAGRRGKPSLVVAPRSLVFNWKREASRFAPAMRLLDHTGDGRRRLDEPGAHFADHDLVITTYGTLRRDADGLAAVGFDYVVLDEAQAIKNDASETARAARRLRADHRLALSGTPVENHLGELWSIVEFLNPGMLGRAAAWKAAADARPSPDAVALLGRALRPILLRRTKREVAPDLPPRLEETWVCELDARDRALYDQLRDRFRAEVFGQVRSEGMGGAQARLLEALLRLRQAACHPGLLDPARRGERGAKLDALIPELVACQGSGQKALVFSQFRSLLDIARPLLEAEGLGCLQLDGTTRDREAMVARFQGDPGCDVLLVSLKAGGVGLNLTAAEYVFLLDPWWNPAAEAQAIDRAHRIGQDKAVFAYRLIAKDTVEERIAELQQRKHALAESVIRGDGAPLRELSAEDLDRLLS